MPKLLGEPTDLDGGELLPNEPLLGLLSDLFHQENLERNLTDLEKELFDCTKDKFDEIVKSL